MNWLPTFFAGAFAVAGAVAALGPILIHLLNRRRYQVVPWAAMEFLREAIKRNRRWLRLRDMLLLALRTLAVLLVGLALARPYWSASEGQFDGTQPLHAVLLIDNSLSMSYESLEGTLLERAVQRAREFIDRLPEGSRVSVLPICGSALGQNPDAATKENALELLDKIAAVDRSVDVQQTWNQARRACEQGPPLARRIIFFSDQQAGNWSGFRDARSLREMPSLQVVDVSPESWENTWVADFRIQDGVADADTPALFLVGLCHQGPTPREGLQVTLSIDGTQVASTTVTLEPGPGVREVTLPFSFQAFGSESGRIRPVTATVSITPDRLPADDTRCLVVPVVAGLPIVFVDQIGAGQEDAIRNQLGETRPLRRLLAPQTATSRNETQPVQVRHLRLEDLDTERLSDTRVIVVAGVADDGGKTQLLREFVQQGGRLMLAAGGAFDAARWTESAWLQGQGVLPAPLLPDPLGTTPDETTDQLQPFYLDYESLAGHKLFQLAGVGEDELRELYSEPVFFKAVQTDLSAGVLETLRRSLRLPSTDPATGADTVAATSGDSAVANGSSRGGADQAGSGTSPRWLTWTADLDADASSADTAASSQGLYVRHGMPRVLARFTDAAHTPALIERRIGRGRVLFFSSGLLPEWNTLSTSNSMLLFDRILRDLIRSTLPPRNFDTDQRIALPLESNQQDTVLELFRPGEPPRRELLEPGFIGANRLGFVVSDPLDRGIYRVRALQQTTGAESDADFDATVSWELPLAVNGEAEESDLASLTRDQFESRTAGAEVRWVGRGEEISLAGTQVRGQHTWWWLILAVLGLLLIEIVSLAAMHRDRPETNRAGELAGT